MGARTSDIALSLKATYARGANGVFTLAIDTQLPGAGTTAVFGVSGSGKTTLLRCVAGLEPTAVGDIRVRDRHWQRGDQRMPTHRRRVGFVFQEASLFPHLTVAGNLAFARRRANGASLASAQDLLELLGIGALTERMPHQLSGGEQQRVAIVRALLSAPELLLMDEPLASLDRQRKQEVLPYLERLTRELSIPMIYVSHQIDEVVRLADHLLLLDRGSVTAQGALRDVLLDPTAARLLGNQAGAVIEGEITGVDADWGLATLSFDGGALYLVESGLHLGQALRAHVLARDVSVALDEPKDTSVLNRLPATLVDVSDDTAPGFSLLTFNTGSTRFMSRVSRRSVTQLALTPGATVWLQIKSAALLR
ncbi:MAG: molybdenum ABC transporter ATP-binding protein [Pseudomonadota bacterium]